MRIIDKTRPAAVPNKSTFDIPVGQVFRGSMLGVNSCELVAGVFYKAYGPCNVRGSKAGIPRSKGGDHIIVRLDKASMTPGYSNVSLYTTVVADYQPLDVELVITGVGK